MKFKVKRPNIYGLFVAVALLIGCNQQGDSGQAHQSIKVSLGVSTRVGASTENVTQLGLHVTNPNSTTHSYTNTLMDKGSDGLFTAKDATTGAPIMMLWQNKTTPVEVIAYAPFKEDCTASSYTGLVASDQSQESDLIVSDLVCQKLRVDPALDLTPEGSIALMLDHKLSRLEVTVRMDEDLMNLSSESNPIESIEIQGSKLGYTLDWGTNMIEATGVAGTVVPLNTTAAPWDGMASYEAILAPQTIGDGQFKVVMRIWDETYTYTLPTEITLKSNTRYNLSITITTDKRVFAQIETAPWDHATKHILTPNANDKITIDEQTSVIPATAVLDAPNNVLNVSRQGVSNAKIVLTGNFDKEYEIIKDHFKFDIFPDENTKFKNSSFTLSAIQSEGSRDYEVKFKVTNKLFPLTSYTEITVRVAAANGN